MVGVDTGTCRSDELQIVLKQLNHEFIHSRERTVELQQRFPDLLRNPENILVTKVHDEIASSLVLKRFIWETPQERYRAAMIGLVSTVPSMRGRGYAGATLDLARSHLLKEETDFAVLWTAQPNFYARRGWIEADCGRYGILPGTGGQCISDPASPLCIDRIEEIRAAYAPMRVHRKGGGYFQLPLPATELRIQLVSGAYAILGLATDNSYVYDILGDAQSFPELWNRISASGRNIHMNVPDCSPAAEWIHQHLHVQLPLKPLAMWLPLSRRARHLKYRSFYIPLSERL